MDRIARLPVLVIAGLAIALAMLVPAAHAEAVGDHRIAATFAASLELARQGRIEIRQADPFAPIRFRRRPPTTDMP